MKYLVQVLTPKNHLVKVRLDFDVSLLKADSLEVYLPSWSPGSYLMREYARHVQLFRVCDQLGREVFFEQKNKNTWKVDPKLFNQDVDSIQVSYEVYGKDLTVRTLHIDESHAFLHGPAYLMTIANFEKAPCEIEFEFSPIWSKLSTALKDISPKREQFLYEARNYDELLDCPVEIGCQETDGFQVDGKNHFLAFYGPYDQEIDLKKDIKTLVEHISKWMGGTPYEDYTFITHFAPNTFGGLEHANSTVLQFDGRRLARREDYLNWLALVAHEYFHTWNVKRIRPRKLGPFDYRNEAWTKMLWLAEGLTSFVDEWVVYRAGLCSLEEYLQMQATNHQRLIQAPGRHFHSLEDASLNAWTKFYRRDENTWNSTVNYYLKGGLVFARLHMDMRKAGKSVDLVIHDLWKSYLDRPQLGLTKDEVYTIIRNRAGESALDRFIQGVETTEDLDFESDYAQFGMKFEWDTRPSCYLGSRLEAKSGRVMVAEVTLDGPAYKSGLNAGDEVLAIDGQRLLPGDLERLLQWLRPNRSYKLVITRNGQLQEQELVPGTRPKKLGRINILDRERAEVCWN